jgi:hypothetical protein
MLQLVAVSAAIADNQSSNEIIMQVNNSNESSAESATTDSQIAGNFSHNT